MKLCSLAPPFETVPSGAKGRARAQFQRRAGHSFNGGLATLLHESEKIFCVKTCKIGILSHNLEKTATCGV